MSPLTARIVAARPAKAVLTAGQLAPAPAVPKSPATSSVSVFSRDSSGPIGGGAHGEWERLPEGGALATPELSRWDRAVSAAAFPLPICGAEATPERAPPLGCKPRVDTSLLPERVFEGSHLTGALQPSAAAIAAIHTKSGIPPSPSVRKFLDGCANSSVSASAASRLRPPIRRSSLQSTTYGAGFSSCLSSSRSSCSSKDDGMKSIKRARIPLLHASSSHRFSLPSLALSLFHIPLYLPSTTARRAPCHFPPCLSYRQLHNLKLSSIAEQNIAKMVSSVNRTALHPSGVLPAREHTEIEEELHDKANIDYDRVAIVPNPSVAALYEDALVYETGTAITSSGALTAYSGRKTGRSPQDKRIVKEPTSEHEIWWGPVNKPMSPEVWRINRERAVDYLNTRSRIYVVDGFAGWDERYRINVRVVCARAYHALFMRNMLIRPTAKELEHFEPDYVIYNAGSFPANRYTEGMTSSTSVAINFAEKEMVILGTEYAGEMKKGVFTVMFYEMPIKHNVLTLHSSANQGKNGDVTVFFGLSGTGKTTLSADPQRALIGDDEHCWTDTGVFNIEGGCYAKCVNLSAEKEPDIFNAIRFGSVLENVVFDPETRMVDYDDVTLTENTRASYPIEYISNAMIPCITSNHPTNIILLCCDARGVLPVISKLTPEQVMYHFISGYTSKMAGTEDGVTEPVATFSACFAQPFLALHPMRYAKMLAEKITEHKANAWLLNTGWVGGSVNKGGRRCPLKYTRAILDSIHSGELANAEYETYEVFNLQIPTHIEGVPSEILNPRVSWRTSDAEFKDEVTGLAQLFIKNFDNYAAEATPEVKAAGPVV